MTGIRVKITDEKELEKVLILAAIGGLYCSMLPPRPLRDLVTQILEQYNEVNPDSNVDVNDMVEFIRKNTAVTGNTETQKH